MIMDISHKRTRWILGLIMALCFMPFVSPAISLGAGILLSVFGCKISNLQKYTSILLQVSIVLMSFGMNMNQVIGSLKSGFLETAISVIVVMGLGILLGKLFKVESKIALLISCGTAICGGSAIAALSSVLGSKNDQNSFALVVVFVLNAIALLIFPYVGHQLNLSQEVFGNWAAIAIHDTSSVVGAGAIYGTEALEIATTVKLIRALWIIPVIITVAIFNKKESNGKIKIPWFIFLFVGGIIISNLLQDYSSTYTHFNWLGKRGMVATLFLIGASISISDLKQSKVNSFVLGVVLWVVISVGSLFFLNL